MIPGYSRLLSGAVLLLALGIGATPSRADSIDGDWCFTDGRHLTIRGPQITTPTGKRLDGNYDRHAFSYVAPAPEADAGKTIAMTLVNENTVHVRSAESPAQVWRRCPAGVSGLQLPDALG